MLLGSYPSYTSILPPAPASGAAGGWLASELRIQDPHFNVSYSLFLQNFSSWVCLSEHDSKSSTPLLHGIHLYLSRVSIISAFAASWNMLMCMCFLAFYWIMTSDSYIALFTYPTEVLPVFLHVESDLCLSLLGRCHLLPLFQGLVQLSVCLSSC